MSRVRGKSEERGCGTCKCTCKCQVHVQVYVQVHVQVRAFLRSLTAFSASRFLPFSSALRFERRAWLGSGLGLGLGLG